MKVPTSELTPRWPLRLHYPDSCWHGPTALLGSHAEVDLKCLGLAVEALLFVQLSKLDAGDRLKK
jgi:hypothetical protein